MNKNNKNLDSLYKKFPDQNPNPILRLSVDGRLKYYNQPSKPIINYFSLKMNEKVKDDLFIHVNPTLSKKEHEFEIKLEFTFYSFKCVYVEELNGINIYGTDITAKKTIDKFPDSNPNPVLRVSYKGILNYHNKGSINLVHALKLKVSKIVPKSIFQYLEEVALSGQSSIYEIQAGNFTYSASFVPIPEFQFIIIYATDITAYKVIKKFPSQNPNPVLRVDTNWKMNYFNESSKYIVENTNAGIGEKLPKEFLQNIFNTKSEFELDIGSKTYAFNIVKVKEFGFNLIYGTDITDSKDKEKILNKLSKYFSPQVYNSIFSGELDVTINTKRKNLTVFFSDIKSFTTITEKLEPEMLTKLITNYLTEMTEIAVAYGGTVDKYIGDGIMIFFGDPLSNGIKKDAIACVSMALEMKKRLRKLKRDWEKTGLSESLDVRMGIHTDVCTVGNFGSIDRLDYTILGNGVNLASRLESLANANEILISENTYNLINSVIESQFFKEVQIKGKSHPVKAYQVLDKISKKPRQDILNFNEQGFTLVIDKKKIANKSSILKILENSIDDLIK